MKHGLLMIAICIAAAALTSGQYSSTLQGGPTSKPDPTTTTTAPPPTTTTTTPAPTTTTHAPNTTTHAPNTTTHAPNTTTHAPNTTTHAPNTTTPIPAPTPPANLTVGKYNSSQDGKLCILADFAIGIRVNTSEVNDTFIVQPSKTTSSGGCSEKTANINLFFGEGSVTLKFVNDDTAQKIYVQLVEVDLTYAFNTKVGSKNYSGKNDSLQLFASVPGHYYSCSSQTVYMGNGLSLDLTHNKIQAFNFKNNEFGTPDVCKADQPDYRVPIAVGIILIILIVIVVIAYLISRKRRTDGYQSL